MRDQSVRVASAVSSNMLMSTFSVWSPFLAVTDGTSFLGNSV